MNFCTPELCKKNRSASAALERTRFHRDYGSTHEMPGVRSDCGEDGEGGEPFLGSIKSVARQDPVLQKETKGAVTVVVSKSWPSELTGRALNDKLAASFGVGEVRRSAYGTRILADLRGCMKTAACLAASRRIASGESGWRMMAQRSSCGLASSDMVMRRRVGTSSLADRGIDHDSRLCGPQAE
jgi:hypothetical protein